MKVTINNVQKGNEYKWLKNKIESITMRFNVKYNYAKKSVIVTYEDPYIVNEDELMLKSRSKKALQVVINELRKLQFESV